MPHLARHWELVCKRAIEIIVSSVLLIILFPLLLVIGIAIKLTSPGPVLYRWPVVGADGRPLTAEARRRTVGTMKRVACR